MNKIELQIKDKETRKYKNGNEMEIASIQLKEGGQYIVTIESQKKGEMRTMFDIIGDKLPTDSKHGLSLNITCEKRLKTLFESIENTIIEAAKSKFGEDLLEYKGGFGSKLSWKKPIKKLIIKNYDFVSSFDIFYDKKTGEIYKNVKFNDLTAKTELEKYRKAKLENDKKAKSKHKKAYKHAIKKYENCTIQQLNEFMPADSDVRRIVFSIPEIKFIDVQSKYNATFKLLEIDFYPGQKKSKYVLDNELSSSSDDDNKDENEIKKTTNKKKINTKKKS